MDRYLIQPPEPQSFTKDDVEALAAHLMETCPDQYAGEDARKVALSYAQEYLEIYGRDFPAVFG